MTTRWYRQGKVTINDSSREVIGIGTNWDTAGNKPLAGDEFYIQGVSYEIESIKDDTHITLYEPFSGASSASSSYAIIRNTSTNISSRIAAMVAHAINSKQIYLNELNSFLTSSADSITMHDSLGNPLKITPIPTIVKNVNLISKGTANLAGIFKKIEATTNKAELWANAAKGIEVEKGKYSARNFAELAEDTFNDVRKVKSLVIAVQAAIAVDKKEIDKSKAAANTSFKSTEIIKAETEKVRDETKAELASVKHVKGLVEVIVDKGIDSTLLAQQWAEEKHNVPVTVTTDPNGTKVNHFSAMHYMRETSKVYDQANDILADTRTVKSGIDTIKAQFDADNLVIAQSTKDIKQAHKDIRALATSAEESEIGSKKLKDETAAFTDKAKKFSDAAAKFAIGAKKSEETARNFAKPFINGGVFKPEAIKEYPTGLTGNALIIQIGGLTKGTAYKFVAGLLQGQTVQNGDLLLAINNGTDYSFFVISVGGSAGGGISTINNKTGSIINLTPADIGTLSTKEIESKFRQIDDFDFSKSAKDIDIGENKVVSGAARLIRYKKDRNRIEIGTWEGPEVFIRTGAKNFQVEIAGNVRTLMTSFDATNLIDDRALLVNGKQLMRGSIKFDSDQHQQTDYDIINLSNAIKGSKNYLRKIRGAKSDMIWHETIQDHLYRLATGAADSKEVFRLDSNLGKAFIDDSEIYTKKNAPLPKDIGAFAENGGGTLRSGYFDIKPKTAIRADMTSDTGKYRDTAEILKMTEGDNGVLEIGSNKSGLRFFYKGQIVVEDEKGNVCTLYHAGNKPTAKDLGLRTNAEQDKEFIKKSGDTVTGKVVIDRGTDATESNALEIKSGSAAPLAISRAGTQVAIKLTATNVNRFIGLSADGSLRWGSDLDISKNSKVYTSDDKPTAKELGLEPVLDANKKRAIFSGPAKPDAKQLAAMNDGDLFLVYEV